MRAELSERLAALEQRLAEIDEEIASSESVPAL